MAASLTPGLFDDPKGEGFRRALLQRVGSSSAFQKSNRLRELLEYVGDRTLSNPDTPIREQEIGIAVFGRAANYDTSQDTLVRVQASQLRKKLQQYFSEEGREEPFIIEMPKGSYSLTFRPREPEAAPELAGAVQALPQRRGWVAWAAAAGCLVLSAVLLVQNAGLRRRAELGMGPHPAVDRLFREMFGNGRQTCLALADANLVVFQDAMKQQINLLDYQRKDFGRLARERIPDPVVRAMALNVVNRPYTGMSDAGIVRRMSLVFAGNELPVEVLLARDLTLAQAVDQNAILLGSRRANPWVTLYEDRLNFQTVFEESPRAAWLENKAPKPGEQSEYRGRWSRLGYCRVAFLRNNKGTGNVLLISGTDVPSTQAGGEFITREISVRRLKEALGVAERETMPHFEVLLETQLIGNAVAQDKLVAWRRH
ncbi:MAG: hypothetical protein HXY18_11785 [Bryobacteraceae bacterium]|nr:hypothetical protein [Bryobacteraceae bacterium]